MMSVLPLALGFSIAPDDVCTLEKKDESNGESRAPEHRTPKGIMSHIRHKVAKGRKRFTESTFDLDLTYITTRIIAMSFPATGLESTYRNNLEDVAKMLKEKHQDKYMVFNLSDRSYDVTKLNFQVLDFGWPDHLAPPLERLCCICKSIDSWLNSDADHVVVVHCKGGKGRTGTVVSAYMHYSNECQSAEAALDLFAMKRFYDEKLGGVTQPSQRRYVHYFEDILKNKITLIDVPLFLQTFILHGIPNFDGRGGCRLFLKIYQNLELIHTSEVYTGTAGQERIKITFQEGLELAGDILVKGFHKTLSGRDIVFRCQFHTCAVTDFGLVFDKSELDDSHRDKRFPDSSRVEFVFSPPLVDIKKGETMHRALKRNSGEMMEDSKVKDTSLVRNVTGQEPPQPETESSQCSPSAGTEHYTGPVDESLYARPRMKTNGEQDGLEDDHPNSVSSSLFPPSSDSKKEKENRRLSEYELNWYRRVQEAGIPLQVKSTNVSLDDTKLSCHSDWYIEGEPIADVRMTSSLGKVLTAKSPGMEVTVPHGSSGTSSQSIFGTVVWSGGNVSMAEDVFSGTPRIGSFGQVPKSKSLDAVLDSGEVTECRQNSYSSWIRSKHKGVAPCLTRQTRVVSEGGVSQQASVDNDWLIQLSPPAVGQRTRSVESVESVSDGEKRESFNPFENIDAAMLEHLKAEIGQRRDNPFADVLMRNEGKTQGQIGGGMKESKNKSSVPITGQPSPCFPVSSSVHQDDLHPKHFISSPDTLSGITLVDALPTPECKKALFFNNRWGGSSQASMEESLTVPITNGVTVPLSSEAVCGELQEPVGEASVAASYASDGPQIPPRKLSGKKEKPVLPPRRPEGLNLGMQFWYKPHLSKADAETALIYSKPGTFIVRDSTSVKGGFSLVMKATQHLYDPSTRKSGGVKHFLIVRTERGLQLKGSAEPPFSSLTQFVLQHSISPLQLPCKLVIPLKDISMLSPVVNVLKQKADSSSPPPKPPLPSNRSSSSNPPTLPPPNSGNSDMRYGVDGPAVKLSDTAIEALMRGAATDLTYLLSVDVPQSSGPEIIRSAVSQFIARGPLQRPTPIHFEVNISGVLLVDKKQTVFFRRHYPIRSVTYSLVDPDNRKWRPSHTDGLCEDRSIFGIVARKPGTMERYTCHLFAENDVTQPATAIVAFVNRVMELSTMQ